MKTIAIACLSAFALFLEGCDSCSNSTLRDDQHDSSRRVYIALKQASSGLMILSGSGSLSLTAGQGNDFVDLDAGARFTDAASGLVPGTKGSGAGLSSSRPLIWALSSTANAVFVIDPTNNSVLNRVNVGTGPARVRVAPDLKTVYVTNTQSDSITVINATNYQVTATIPLPIGTHPTGLAITPDGSRLWVIGQNAALVVDPGAKNVIATIPTGTGATYIALTPDGTLAYVANNTAGSISVIDTLTNQVVKTVTGIPSASSIAFDKRGTVAYAAGASSLFILNTSDYSVATKLSVGNTPVHVARDAFGSVVYIVNQGSADITLIDGAFQEIIGSIKLSGSPTAILSIP